MEESQTMAEALANFHFLRPWWLLALIPALLFVVRLWRQHARGSAWREAIDKRLLPYLLDKRPGGSQRLPLILLATAWSVAIVALAGPSWERLPQPVQQRQDALVIVLDQSLAMFATDFQPNRHTIAKRKVSDILNRRIEGRTGLVVYSQQAHVVTPLTQDNNTIQNLVPSLSPNIMPAFGNNPTHGIELALELLQDHPSARGRILLVTGGVPSSQHPSIRDLLADTPYSLSILGVGTQEGAPVPAAEDDYLTDNSGQRVIPRMDNEALSSLANSLDGRYHDVALSSADLDHLLANNRLPSDSDYRQTDREFDVWRDTGPWLALMLVPLGAFLFRRGWLLSIGLASTVALSFHPSPARAQAVDWQSLWQTPDQQGAEVYEQGNHQQAARLFRSPKWRGTAHYRAGNYEAAIEAFSQGDDIESMYNLGNAYARAQMFERAIAAYDAVLERDSDHEDARHNRELVQQMLEQQQQEQQQQQQQQQQQSDQQQQNQQQSSQQQQQQQDQQSSEEQAEEAAEGDSSQQDQQQRNRPNNQQQSGQNPENANSQQDQEQSQNENSSPSQSGGDTSQTEDQESLEQWLRRIEDDPEELLQRKFRFEYQQRQREARSSGNQL